MSYPFPAPQSPLALALLLLGALPALSVAFSRKAVAHHQTGHAGGMLRALSLLLMCALAPLTAHAQIINPTIVDASNAPNGVGDYTSQAVIDGKPAISYWDATNKDLKFAINSAADGSGTWKITTVDSVGDVGTHTSLASVFGRPAISYYDATNGDLKFAINSADNGSGTWKTTTVDSAGDVGTHTSLAQIYDKPAISYYDSTNGDLKFAINSSADSSGTWRLTTVDSVGDVGQFTSLASVNGKPAISYYDSTNGDLKFTINSATDGRGTWTTTTADSAGIVGQFTSLIQLNGKPAISYFDSTNADLKFATNIYYDGSGTWTKTIVDSAGDVGTHTSLALVNGKPSISYVDDTNNDLKFAVNNSTDGSGSWSPIIVDSAGGLYNSLAQVNGEPAISYHGNGGLKWVRLVYPTAPVISNVTIAPMNPKTNETLTTTVQASDDDGDKFTYSYVWRKNDVVIPGETGPSLDLSKPGNGDDSDIIDVVVTAHDSTYDSEPRAANSVEIGNIAPQILGIRPDDASDRVGAKRTFTVTMSDGNGASDIREMWLLINTTLDWNAGATLIYRPSASSLSNGQLFLRSGDAFLPPIQIGKGARPSAFLDNGAVRVTAKDVSVTTYNEGESLDLSITATIRDGLVGQNIIYARVQDSDGAVDLTAFPDEFGFIFGDYYNVTSQFSGFTNRAPTLSKLTPGDTTTLNGSGLALATQNFGFFVQDADGIGDIEEVWFLANKTRDWKNSATFVYYPRTRRLVLRSDDGNSWLGGGQIGTPGLIENSQVKVDLSKVKLTIVDGKSFGLTLPLQARTGLLGNNNIWLRVQDIARMQDITGITSPDGDDLGFVRKGTWNVKASNVADPKPQPSNGNS